MARKRMFDLDLINQDSFYDLPMEAKALYFLLGMEADDEGFISPKKVLRLYGGNDDSIKILIAKNYLIPFESGVVVITDWNYNNYLQNSRVKPTIYQDEKRLLGYDTDTKKYVINSMFNNCLTNVEPEEKRREENSIEENSILLDVKPKKEPKKKYGEYKNVLLTDKEYEKLKLDFKNIEDWIKKLDEGIELKGYKYKNHNLAIRKWAKNDNCDTKPRWIDDGYKKFETAESGFDFSKLGENIK